MKTKKLVSNFMKSSCSVFLAAILTFSFTASASAEEVNSGKEEVVYAMLNNNGTINGMYVVNIFDKNGDIVDYGDYSNIRNMNTNDKITQDGNKITVTNTANKLYYEGTLKKHELPWNISIKYYLDGKEYSADNIAGKSGALTIEMKVTQNTNCNETFYKNYALQAAFTLNSEKCKNIKSDDATVANVGNDKQLSYVIFPNKGADIKITSDVKDFSMDAITINGVQLNLKVQVDDNSLMEKVNELKSSVNTLDNGANDLNNGASNLQSGADKLVSGASELKNGAANLDNGAASLNSGVKQVQAGLNELNSKSASLTTGSAQVKAALEKIQSYLSKVSITSDQISTLVNASSNIKTAIKQIYSGIDALKSSVGYAQYKAAMKGGGLDIDNLKAGNTHTITTLSAQITTLTASYNQIKDVPGYETQAAQLKSQIDQLTNIVTLLNGNNAAIGGTETYLNNVSAAISQLYTGASELESQYEIFDSKIAVLGQTLSGMLIDMTNLSTGINTLTAQYNVLDGGINDYTNGVAQIVSGYSNVVNGTSALASGSKQLADGSITLYTGTTDLMNGSSKLYSGTSSLKNGTGEFKAKTSNLDTKVSNQIDDVISGINGDGSAPVSFASSENTNIRAVQFVIKTNAIKVQKVATKVKTQTKTLNLWQKFLNLFD